MTSNRQHLIYTAIPNFPARLSVVVDTQVWIKQTTLKGSSISHPTPGDGHGEGVEDQDHPVHLLKVQHTINLEPWTHLFDPKSLNLDIKSKFSEPGQMNL